MATALGPRAWYPPRKIEPVADIVATAEKTLENYRTRSGSSQSDWGFGCFAGRLVSIEEVACKKLWAILEAAKMLRRKYC